MTEPTSSAVGAAASFSGGLIVLMGPILGPWVTVLLASFSGALWAMGRAETESRAMAAWLLMRVMLTALVLTGGIAAMLSQFMSWSLDHALPAVAFGIGAMGDKMGVLREAISQRLRTLIGGA